jgi:hypothetical protein
MLFALLAIVCGSQQLLLLPKAEEDVTQSPSDMQKRQENFAKIKARLTRSDRDSHSQLRLGAIFTLQAPIMLMTFSVMTFLSGLLSVVFSPVAREPRWDGDAKVIQ